VEKEFLGGLVHLDVSELELDDRHVCVRHSRELGDVGFVLEQLIKVGKEVWPSDVARANAERINISRCRRTSTQRQ
jgi:hypothetical protein